MTKEQRITRRRAFILSLAGKVLGAILSVVTPIIKEQVESFVKELWVKVKQTENPTDDIFVEALAKVLNIDLD